MQTDAVLERLQQQVQAGSCRIATACSRLEATIQTLCRDEMTRPFLAVLPRILSLVFGDEAHAGWLECATDGVLFGATLTHSGLDCVSPFEFPASQLPVPLQKHLAKHGLHGLPLPLDSCIVNAAREGPALYLVRVGMIVGRMSYN